MKYRIALFLLLSHAMALRADLIIGPWTPIFKGVDHVVATNCPPTTVINNGMSITDSTLQVVHCVRVDLTDPDVQLFTTPRAPSWAAESRETLSLTISNFIRNYKVQIAADANFYSVNPGGSDPSSEGLPAEVEGFLVSTGQVVSPISSDGRYATMLFKTNNVPSFNFDTRTSATDTNGIWTAVTGYYPVLTNGVNVWALYNSAFLSQYPDSFVHGSQPRTGFGISQDKRYLFLMTIDGRQPGSGGGSCGTTITTCGLTVPSSNGALDAETGLWLLQFGAWDAISMDGGGSTVLYMADCGGEPIGLNHSSLLASRCAERIIGCHFGVYAKPLPSAGLNNLVVSPADTTAVITWQTSYPATTQLDYGSSLSYGNSFSNTNLTTNHVVTLNGLSPSSSYYFRVSSVANGDPIAYACRVSTTASALGSRTDIFSVTKAWRWITNSLDGTNWQAAHYDDLAWAGPSAGLLYCENNFNVTPKNTPLPPNNGTPNGTPVAPTFYFRTHFTFNGSAANLTLYFTNYIDDGAVFYLNGTEIKRIRMSMAPTNITYTSITDPPGSGPPCPGQGNANDATCPDIFSISGDLLTNLISGDNVLAVEVHQSTSGSTDIVFGSALSYSQNVVPQPTLKYVYEAGTLTLYWNGSGFTLQQADVPSGSWSNTTFNASPVSITTPPDVIFYQLHK